MHRRDSHTFTLVVSAVGVALVATVLAGCGGQDAGKNAATDNAEEELDQAMEQFQKTTESTSEKSSLLDDFRSGWASHIYRFEQNASDVQLGMAFVGVASDPSSWLSDQNVYVRGCVSVSDIDGAVTISSEDCPKSAASIGLDQYSPALAQVELRWNLGQ